MSVNPTTIRTTLAELLRAGCPDAMRVYPDEPGDLGKKSPIIVLSRRGRGRNKQGQALRTFQTKIKLWLDVYVAAPDGRDYTDAEAAALLDTMAYQIDAVIDQYQTAIDSETQAKLWQAIEYDIDSEIEFGIFNDDGVPRWREHMGLVVTVFA